MDILTKLRKVINNFMGDKVLFWGIYPQEKGGKPLTGVIF